MSFVLGRPSPTVSHSRCMFNCISSHHIIAHILITWYLCCLPLLCEGTFHWTHLWFCTSGAAQSSCGTSSPSYTITHADCCCHCVQCRDPRTHLTSPHRTSSQLTHIPGIFVASLSFAKGHFLALTCGFTVTSGYLLFSSVLREFVALVHQYQQVAATALP